MSTQTQLPLYGRKYSLTISLPPDASGDRIVLSAADSDTEPEALRMTFDVRTVFYQVAWAAEIALYNLDLTTTKQILGGAGQLPKSGNQSVTPVKQGMLCTLSAGYQKGKFGIIWSGPVFQATFERQEAVDFKVTLHCLLWLDPMTRNHVAQPFAAFTTQTDLIQQLASRAFSDKPSVKISDKVNPAKQSRGGVLFGSARKHLHEIADDNNMQWFMDSRGLAMARVDDNIPADSEAILFRPPVLPTANTAGPTIPSGAAGAIVGTPQQTQYGVRFTALLDPTVVVKYPAQLVKIDNSQIVMLKKQIGQLPGVLDQSGTYIVMGVRYWGDTRGTPWYIEVDGLTSVNGKWAAAQYLAERAAMNGYK